MQKLEDLLRQAICQWTKLWRDTLVSFRIIIILQPYSSLQDVDLNVNLFETLIPFLENSILDLLIQTQCYSQRTNFQNQVSTFSKFILTRFLEYMIVP